MNVGSPRDGQLLILRHRSLPPSRTYAHPGTGFTRHLRNFMRRKRSCKRGSEHRRRVASACLYRCKFSMSVRPGVGSRDGYRHSVSSDHPVGHTPCSSFATLGLGEPVRKPCARGRITTDRSRKLEKAAPFMASTKAQAPDLHISLNPAPSHVGFRKSKPDGRNSAFQVPTCSASFK